MEPPWPVWIPWPLLVVGATLGAVYVFRVIGASINAAVFAMVVRKLLAAANVDRTLKLCRAASPAPVAAAVHAAVVACGKGIAHDHSAADYRSAGDLSPERVLAPVRAAYDAAFAASASRVRYARYAAIVSALLLVAALALALSHPSGEPLPAVGAGLGLLLLAWAALRERAILFSRGATYVVLAEGFDTLIRDPSRVPVATPLTRVRVAFEVSEPGRPMRVVESDSDVIKIGSMETAQVCLDAPGVSRMHAVVECADDGFSVIDLGGRPTTRVNGEAVNKRELSDGDVLSIGDAELRVRLYG